MPPPFLLFTFYSAKTDSIAYPIKFCFKFKFVGFSKLAWFILVPLGFLRNSCLPEWISHLCSGLLCGFSRQLWLRAPGTAGRSFNTWTGDGMLWGQAAVSRQEERGQVGPPNALQIFPLPQQRLPIRLNNTGAVFFFPLWTTVPGTAGPWSGDHISGVWCRSPEAMLMSVKCVQGIRRLPREMMIMWHWGGRRLLGNWLVRCVCESDTPSIHFKCSQEWIIKTICTLWKLFHLPS